MPYDLDVSDSDFRKHWPRQIVISCPTHPELEPIVIQLTDDPQGPPEVLWIDGAMPEIEEPSK